MNKKSLRLKSVHHPIWPALLTFLAVALVACAPAGASQDPAGKQLPPTPVVPTASPTLAQTPTVKFISAAGPTPSAVLASAGAYRSYESDKYSYTMSYLADWKIEMQTAGPSAPGDDRENVFLTFGPGQMSSLFASSIIGEPVFSWLPLISTVVSCVIFIVIAICRFNRQEF